MMKHWPVILVWLLVCGGVVSAQEIDAAKSKVELGSRTAKGGFRNEDEIRDKFNNWKSDADARAWLEAMNHSVADVSSVSATKPHGEKADVEVTVKSKTGERVERISIKLVSSPNGFNQIDKRWVKTYATLWKMPPDVVESLKLFVGETSPRESSRDKRRMYLGELDQKAQQAVVDFFTANKAEIVSDLLAGRVAGAGASSRSPGGSPKAAPTPAHPVDMPPAVSRTVRRECLSNVLLGRCDEVIGKHVDTVGATGGIVATDKL